MPLVLEVKSVQRTLWELILGMNLYSISWEMMPISYLPTQKEVETSAMEKVWDCMHLRRYIITI
jgi:hypothetical protein